MIGLVALITLVALVIRSRCGGDPWLIAMLTGVRRSLLGTLAVYSTIVVLAMGLELADAVLRPVANAAMALLPEGHPPASRASGMPAAMPARKPEVATTSPLPTPTPRVVKLAYQTSPSLAAHTPSPVAQELMVAPTSTPRPVTPTPTPTPTPASSRTGCDPAYPDARTCIPPGPPWDQGCSITPERRFTVLPPDPQGLDHDLDGIGCEPIS